MLINLSVTMSSSWIVLHEPLLTYLSLLQVRYEYQKVHSLFGEDKFVYDHDWLKKVLVWRIRNQCWKYRQHLRDQRIKRVGITFCSG